KRVHLENIAKFQRYTKDLVKEKERYLANTQEALDTEMSGNEIRTQFQQVPKDGIPFLQSFIQ
ncbi:7996_t:CDS:2, partial [Entrophospora sp. SA101]